MPEAAIDEDRQPCADKNDVRTHDAFAKAYRVIDPEPKSTPVELRADGELSPAVAPPVPAHTLADFDA